MESTPPLAIIEGVVVGKSPPSVGRTAEPKVTIPVGGSAPKPKKSCPAVNLILALPADVALLPSRG